MNTRASTLLIGMVAALSAACSDTTSPGTTPPDATPPVNTPDTTPVAGRYALQSAAGKTLPALIQRSVDATTNEVYDVYVLSDTLNVTADGHYEQRARIEVRVGDLVIGRSHHNDRGRLKRTSDALQFTSEYIQNIAFAGTLVTTGSIRIRQDLAAEGTLVDYSFQRLP